jgi:hypothetical protein
VAKITIKSVSTYPCFNDLVHFLQQSRGNEVGTDLRMAINHAIIFYSACYVEGAMEQILKVLLRRRSDIFNKIKMPELETRRTTNTLFRALEEDLEIRISRSTGIDSYLSLIELLTETSHPLLNKPSSKKPAVSKLLEGIKILFQFRNMLAHGREIRASRVSAWWINEPWQDHFSGGYGQAEQYLIKAKLLDHHFMESDNVALFFTDDIADHFWSLACSFLKAIATSLEVKDKKAVIKLLRVT